MSRLQQLRTAAEQALAQTDVSRSDEAEQVATAGRALAATWVPRVQVAGTDYRLSTVAAHLHRLNGQPRSPCLVWIVDHRPGDRLVTIGDVVYYLDVLHGRRDLHEMDPHDERAVLDSGLQAEREGWLKVRSVNIEATTEMLAAELADRTEWLRTRDPLGASIAEIAMARGGAAEHTAGGLAVVRYAAAAWTEMREAQRATFLVLLEDGQSLFEAIDVTFALGS
jgi:hypothetical protein